MKLARQPAINLTINEIYNMWMNVRGDQALRDHMMSFVHDLESMEGMSESEQDSLLRRLTMRAEAGIL